MPFVIVTAHGAVVVTADAAAPALAWFDARGWSLASDASVTVQRVIGTTVAAAPAAGAR